MSVVGHWCQVLIIDSRTKASLACKTEVPQVSCMIAVNELILAEYNFPNYMKIGDYCNFIMTLNRYVEEAIVLFLNAVGYKSQFVQ